MKKLLFFISCFVIACKPIITKPNEKINTDKILQVILPDSSGGGTLRFMKIEDHDYIMWHSDKGVSMCHNENCTNENHHKK